MSDDHVTSSGTEPPRSDAVRAVARISARARTLRVVSACCALVILVLVSIAVAAAVDALVRFPAPVRAVILVIVALMVAVDVRKFLIPAFRFRPRPIEIAQRIERQRPELAGHLAAAVDFELSGVSRTNELAAYAVRNLEDRARGMDLGAVLKLRPTAMRVLGAALALGSVTLFTVAEPGYASIALRRVLAPWSDAAWPARTAVESLLQDGLVAPKGSPVLLRARLTKGDAASERVFVRFRTVRDAATGSSASSSAWSEVAMSRQPSGEFERLIDADGDRVEYAFLTRDAETTLRSVRLVEPPRVEDARAVVRAPAYAERVVSERRVELGDGTVASSTARDPLLDGSKIRLEMRLSRPLPLDAERPAVWMVGAAERGERPAGKGAGTGAAAAATAGAGDGSLAEGQSARRPLVPQVDESQPTKWTVEFVVQGPVRIETLLVDEDGIRQSEPAVFVFDSIADRAPTASIVEPLSDESVVADARVRMRAEHRDDLELKGSGIEIATRLGKADADSLVFEERAVIEGSPTASGLERELEIGKLGLAPGDSVVLRAFAEDYFDGLGVPAESHGRVRSAPRVLRIVGEEEFERQIRSALAGVRRDAMRSDDRQARAREQLERDPADASLSQAQGGVTEGLARMRESAEQALARLSRNNRLEGSLADLARQAQDLAATAEARSSEANEAIERLARQADAKTEQDRERRAANAKEAAERQDEVRAELEDLIGLLDRDEDAWAARRKLESLTNRVRQLARETEQKAQRSAGESSEQLSPESRAELGALSEKQRKAAEEAEKTIAEMRERAKALAEADAQQSRGLEAAAEATEEGKVREEMDQASDDTAQNRLEQAAAAQQRALQALQKAAQALEEDRKVRAKELARMMDDLVRAIERLLESIETSKGELERVSDGAAEGDVGARDGLAAQFGKLSQNTRGTAADARLRSREAVKVARALDSAAASMASVAGSLRSDAFKRADAMGAADAAITQLRNALKQAEEAAARAEERAAEERREELLVKYREFLERQTVIRDAGRKLAPDADRQLGRRELVESRRLATSQEELREAINGVLESEKEVKESDTLLDMHQLIDIALVDSKARLSEGKPHAALPSQEDAIEALSAIVTALDEAGTTDDKDMFAEKQQDGESDGSGQGGSEAVPPTAEVKLLRAMQQGLARRTRALDETGAVLDPVLRAQRLGEIAARQQRILELGSKLAKKIRSGGKAPTVEPSTSEERGGEKTDDRGQPPATPGGEQP